MKLLELFAGSRSVGKEAEKLGIEVFSVDKFITENIDFVGGVEEITKEFILEKLGTPDIIWASPVCSVWSKIGWHLFWDAKKYSETNKFFPIHPFASESVEMVRKTIEIFSWFPSAIFFMENPEGFLSKHPVINNFVHHNLHTNLHRHTVTYCQYGDTVRKPTHIWTNCINWQPRKTCRNGDNCHILNPRKTDFGTKGKPKKERSKIPAELCKEILENAMQKLFPAVTVNNDFNGHGKIILNDDLRNYPGNKGSFGVYHNIINHIPVHKIYIEPFLGSGAIMRYKKPAQTNWGNDIDENIISKWREVSAAQIKLTVMPALKLLSTVTADRDTFVYIDAPYLKHTRRSRRNIYKYEMNERQHRELLFLVLTANFNCMISHYPCSLYDEMLKDWNKVEFEVMTHTGKRTEAIYMNYPIPTKLHDYRYIGKDCWDRQRIHRKIDRWANRLKTLPELERNAILDKFNIFDK
jgi:DNA adenine methylase